MISALMSSRAEVRDGVEQSILAAAMLRDTSRKLAINLLGPSGCFHNTLHGTIWQSILSLSQKGLAVDYASIISDLESSGKNSHEITMRVVDCASKLAYSGHVETYCEQLLGFERQECLREEVEQISGAIRCNESDEAVAAMVGRLGATFRAAGRIPDPVSGSIEEVAASIINRWDSGGIVGTATGYPPLDMSLHGMKPGELIIVAARPGQGKSALGINIALNIGLTGGAVVIYSLEMDEEQVISRMISASMGESIRAAMTPIDRATKLRPAIDQLLETKIHLDCTPSITLDRLTGSMARYAGVHGPPALVVVDYLQLIRVHGIKNRWEEVGAISRGLKALAGECRCPVLAAAQLSRESEKVARPMLSHLRESGSIEQDADVVILMHRPDPATDIMSIDIAKNRSGPIGSATLYFDRNSQRIRAYGQHGPIVPVAPKVWPKTTELNYTEPEDEVPF